MIHTPNDPCACGMAMWSERWVTDKEGPKLLSDWKRRLFCAGCDAPKPVGTSQVRAKIDYDDYWEPPPAPLSTPPKSKRGKR